MGDVIEFPNSRTTQGSANPFDYETALAEFRAHAWRGIYGSYGDIVGREVRHWAAAHAALCAYIGRRLTFVHAYPHYGMEYVLLIVSTGKGKTTAARLAEPLSGPHVTVETDFQSGQSLAEVIADIEWGTGRNEKIPQSIHARPTLLRPAELSSVLALGKASTSILLPKLCELYDADSVFSIRRVRGNGTIQVEHPEASLFTLCPQGLFCSLLNEQHVSSGFMNRFLILLGAGERFGPFAPYYDYGAIRALADSLPSPEPFPFGASVPSFSLGDLSTGIQDFYTPAAVRVYRAWWDQVAPIYNDGENPLSDWLSRIQAHFHRAALVPVYCDQRTHIEEEDALCAAAVLNLSVASIGRLVGDGTALQTDLPQWKRHHITVEQHARRYLKALYPQDVLQRDATRHLTGGGSASSSDVNAVWVAMEQEGSLAVTTPKPKRICYVPTAEEQAEMQKAAA